MSVEFNETGGMQRPNFGQNDTPKIAAWLISKGYAKDVDGANKIQIGAAVAIFVISFILFMI